MVSHSFSDVSSDDRIKMEDTAGSWDAECGTVVQLVDNWEKYLYMEIAQVPTYTKSGGKRNSCDRYGRLRIKLTLDNM